MPNLLLISFLCFLCYLHNGVEADVAQKYAGYNEGYARFLLSFTSGAYSMTPKECIESTSRMYKKDFKLLKKQVNATCDGKGNSCAFYASVSPSTCEMIVIFRGTTGKSQLLQEGILGMKPNMEFFGHGTVNRYFFNALEAMWHEVKEALEDSRYRSCKTTFTGHSLGGALASAAALRTVIEGLRQSEQVQLYTFGQPRTGNYKFAMEHDRLIPVSFRVVNGADMVPHVPLCRFSDNDAPSDANTMQDENTAPISADQLSDSDDSADGDSGDFSLVDVVKARPCKAGQTRKAYHHGTEVWYPDGMTGSSFCFVVCQGHPKNEDHACSNGVHLNSGWKTWRRYVKNHIIYFGQHISKYGQNKCQPLMATETAGTSVCKALLKNPPPVWKPPTTHNLDDEDSVIGPGRSPTQQSEPEEECKNQSPMCGKAVNMCSLEAYRLLMLVKCPEKCGMCEDHKHLPSSKNKCKNSSLSCFTKLKKAKCTKDAKIRAECPYSCGSCK